MPSPERKWTGLFRAPCLLRLQQAPIMILAVLGKHFRQLYTARVALESGEGSRWLMELWGCGRPIRRTS